MKMSKLIMSLFVLQSLCSSGIFSLSAITQEETRRLRTRGQRAQAFSQLQQLGVEIDAISKLRTPPLEKLVSLQNRIKEFNKLPQAESVSFAIEPYQILIDRQISRIEQFERPPIDAPQAPARERAARWQLAQAEREHSLRMPAPEVEEEEEEEEGEYESGSVVRKTGPSTPRIPAYMRDPLDILVGFNPDDPAVKNQRKVIKRLNKHRHEPYARNLYLSTFLPEYYLKDGWYVPYTDARAFVEERRITDTMKTALIKALKYPVKQKTADMLKEGKINKEIEDAFFRLLVVTPEIRHRYWLVLKQVELEHEIEWPIKWAF